MAVGPITSISAGGLSQEALTSGDTDQLQQSLQSLQNNLAAGNLNGAQSAFQGLESFLQNSATASGGTLGSNSQLSNNIAALGSALSSGDLSTAQTAFASVLGDLKNSAVPSQINEAAAASQSVQLVDELLSPLDPSNSANNSSSSSSISDLTDSILESVYGSESGLNVYG
jgi:hypothetical protein